MNFINNIKIRIIFIIILLIQLFYISNIRTNFSLNTFKNSFIEDFGSENILPKNILELKFIAQKNNLKTINISKKARENDFLFQRTTEFLYPIKVKLNSNKIFYLKNEKIQDNCINLTEFEYWILIEC